MELSSFKYILIFSMKSVKQFALMVVWGEF